MEVKTEKNVDTGTQGLIKLEQGILIHIADGNKEHVKLETITKDNIQFHFCLSGKAVFNFNESGYKMGIAADETILLYNPQKALPLNAQLYDQAKIISVFITIKKLHTFFSEEAAYIPFLKMENIDKKFYDKITYSPAIAVILNQIINNNLQGALKTLYLRGKIFELMSLYFNKNDQDTEQCPFLVDEENVIKIRNAKDIIIHRLTEPPSLPDLAKEVDISLKKLKAGFKQIYGDTVYGFLFNYKMELARKLLEEKMLNVNEIGLRLGYSTSSHFITAFKKTFGITPKKYIQKGAD
ncbi:MAG: AraC family transcriptional regulator [Flavobacteriales bacterium]|nr:MAG: AraC family transcriptional regulator [Flavobacteriales bacterium]PIE49310.1 MAG: AraC family transcriptional regulator [Flavobacteriales bacterium]